MQSDSTAGSRGSGLSRRSCRLLAGLETGLWGGVLVVLWLVIDSMLRGDLWYSKLNIAGAAFYGPAIYQMGRGRATIAGLALLVVIYSVLGAIFGLFGRTRGFLANLLLGITYALAWDVFAQQFIWRLLDSSAPGYFSRLATLMGHLLFGLSLTRFPVRFHAIATAFGAEEEQQEPAEDEHTTTPGEGLADHPAAPAEQEATEPHPPGGESSGQEDC
jgi:hypothetical protein